MEIILATLLSIVTYAFLKSVAKHQKTHGEYMGALYRLDKLKSKTGYYNKKDS